MVVGLTMVFVAARISGRGEVCRRPSREVGSFQSSVVRRQALAIWPEGNHSLCGTRGFDRLRKKPWDCHPEEPQAVLSNAKEESRIALKVHRPRFFVQFILSHQSEILRLVNDSEEAFFRNLSS